MASRWASSVSAIAGRRSSAQRPPRRAAPRGSARSPRRSRRARAARRGGGARFPWRERRPAVALAHATSATPAAASAPSWAGPSRAPAADDALRRRERLRREDEHSRAGATGSAISISLSRSTTYSMGTTASAPSGSDSTRRDPHRLAGLKRLLGRPACRDALRRRAASRACPPRAAANPSIAELGNGGRSTSAVAASASTRPARRLRVGRARQAAVARARESGAAPPRSSEARPRSPHTVRAADRLSRRDLGRRPRSRRGADGRAPLRRARRRRSSHSVSRGRPCSSTTARRDGSFAALTRLHDAHDNVRVVRLRRNFGKAAALAAGFCACRGRHRGHDRRRPPGRPDRDPAARSRSSTRASTSSPAGRRTAATRSRRRVPSKIFNWVDRAVFPGVRLHDLNCGLKAYRAEVRPGPAALRRAAPLHPGPRALPRPPHRRAAGQPPPARARPLAVRRRALRTRLPRPADRLVHRAATATGRCTSSAASGCCSARSASAVLVYLTILQARRRTRSGSDRC